MRSTIRSGWIEEDGGLIRAISIEQGDGVSTIVRFYARNALVGRLRGRCPTII